jgi:Rieske Fe-S protein
VSERIVYITKTGTGELLVLSAVCPHLGCSVQWQDPKKSFVCPCHSATYQANGTRTGGPAPRNMDTLESKIANGRLLVRYQYFRQLVPTKEVIG